MALKVGDIIPEFTAQDAYGNVFKSENIIGKSPVVIYFYPKDDTPGCTAQACGFRDNYEIFKEHGAEVIGISSDTVIAHENFASKYKLPFTLLSDSDNKIRNVFGVQSDFFGLIPGRVTYVVDNNGIIVMIFDSILASKHIVKALNAIKKIV